MIIWILPFNRRTGAVATWTIRFTQLPSYIELILGAVDDFRVGVLRTGQVATASCSAVECHYPDGSSLDLDGKSTLGMI